MENLQLTALVPHDMEPAQQQLISWCEKKINELKVNLTEMQQSVIHAAKMKWAVKPLKNQELKLSKRVMFFEKMKVALENGFTIVPNFPITIFAIKTNRKEPLQKWSDSNWDSKFQEPLELPVGKGEYKNPFPLIMREKETVDGKTEYSSYATDWDELEFPLIMAKPEIIEATNRAMLTRCFDQFGILPAARNQDPIIVGQIKNGKKLLSFMIAWHFDTKIL